MSCYISKPESSKGEIDIHEKLHAYHLIDVFNLFPIPTDVNLSKICSTLSPVFTKNTTFTPKFVSLELAHYYTIKNNTIKCLIKVIRGEVLLCFTCHVVV